MLKKIKNASDKHVISCGCVVYRYGDSWGESQVLLIKQFSSNDVWSIPKGKINPEESFEECAIRETHEETGISVRLEDRLEDIKIALKNKDKTVISFLAQQVCDKDPNIDDPDSGVAAAAWFSVEKLPELQAYQKQLIHEALGKLKANFKEKNK